MTIAASSTSWWRTDSIARSSESTTRSRPPSARACSSSTSRWNCPRRSADGMASAELAGDVVLGPRVLRLGEDRVRVVDLHQHAGPAGALDVEEGRVVARARGLLHVVGHDHDRVVLLELGDEVLDGQRRDRVERRGGLVHEQDLGLDRRGAGDAQALLLAAGEAGAGLAQAVLD